jgi:hypothetical protein
MAPPGLGSRTGAMGGFSELRLLGILRSSLPANNMQVTTKILQLSDTPTPLTAVCCRRFVGRGPHVKAQDRYLPLS